MNVHEYQGKDLLRAFGVVVQDGYVTSTASGAAAAFDRLGGGLVVVKSQVHAGGRGKGVVVKSGQDPFAAYEVACGRQPAPEGTVRGVKLAKTKAETQALAEAMLGNILVTYQTGPVGQSIAKVLVAEAQDIEHEYYLGITVDRRLQRPVIMASPQGGVDIETVAREHPDQIFVEPIDVGLGLADFQVRKLCKGLGFNKDVAKKAVVLFEAFVKMFIEKDVALAEINPLIVTKDGEVMALDAKIAFDDNAMYRHADLQKLRDPEEEDPLELRASKSSLSYVRLEGNIACLVNGAGLAMSTMDLIKYHGGEPANFLDVGGGADKQQVLEGFRILLADPNVKAVLVNIFGGIMKCDIIAEALLAAYDELDFNVPLVVRLEGTNVEKGMAMLRDSGRKIITAVGLTDAAKKVVAAAAAH